MILPPYPNLRKAEKIKSTLKDITGRFLSSLFDSSVMLQAAETVCTVRSLIDSGCGILGRGLEKISKTNSRDELWREEGWKKVKILIPKGRVGF